MGRSRKTDPKKLPNIVNASLSPQAKAEFDKICDQRGMSIKTILGRLITWFAALDKTEQAIVLGQVDGRDFAALADQLVKRRRR